MTAFRMPVSDSLKYNYIHRTNEPMAPVIFLPGTLEALSNFLKELSMKKDKKAFFVISRHV